jgi:hypothetical protein
MPLVLGLLILPSLSVVFAFLFFGRVKTSQDEQKFAIALFTSLLALAMSLAAPLLAGAAMILRDIAFP